MLEKCLYAVFPWLCRLFPQDTNGPDQIRLAKGIEVEGVFGSGKQKVGQPYYDSSGKRSGDFDFHDLSEDVR